MRKGFMIFYIAFQQKNVQDSFKDSLHVRSKVLCTYVLKVYARTSIGCMDVRAEEL